ncbi:phage tail domain-containing protein [Sporosarcina globispora]|uniref:phage tail domain-containing protein n=1 Tax=Sporosarcina globispora TaxID=1459 RepID=UPI000AE44902|nr:phage tail domain-containing protein [Sporosarcina globispora]
MAIYQYEHFHYAGIDSEVMGALNIQTDSGLFEETTISNRNINETRIRGRAKSYLHSVEQDPLEFPINVYFEHGYTDEEFEEAIQWLNQMSYQPFYVMGTEQIKIIYCMPTGEIKHLHNGNGEGYLSLTMRSNSPYLYSPVFDTVEYDLRDNTSAGVSISIYNGGHIETKPFINLITTAEGDISIVNQSNNNSEFKFTGLASNETITIDNESEEIETDIPHMYRMKDFNLNFLDLVKGHNDLIVYGKCKIQFKYEYIYVS